MSIGPTIPQFRCNTQAVARTVTNFGTRRAHRPGARRDGRGRAPTWRQALCVSHRVTSLGASPSPSPSPPAIPDARAHSSEGLTAEYGASTREGQASWEDINDLESTVGGSTEAVKGVGHQQPDGQPAHFRRRSHRGGGGVFRQSRRAGVVFLSRPEHDFI